MSQSNAGYKGFAGLDDGGSEFNRISFAVRQMLAQVRTAMPVQVVSCTNSGGLSPAGRVDVQPLVNQVNGAAAPTPHGVIHGLLYVRIQGGASAVIIDPSVGDIGVAVFCDRDISAVKATGKQANPGSWRTFSMADGLYIGGALNAVPTQYVQFADGGINIVSPGTIDIAAAGGVTISGGTTIDSRVFLLHEHPDPQGGTTGPVV